MSLDAVDRRDFLKTAVGPAAVLAALPATASAGAAGAGEKRRPRTDRVRAPSREQPRPPRIRFAVIGTNHPHIYSQVGAVQRGGGELVSVFVQEPDLLAART